MFGELILPSLGGLLALAHRAGWGYPGPAVEEAMGAFKVSPACGINGLREQRVLGVFRGWWWGFLSSVTANVWEWVTLSFRDWKSKQPGRNINYTSCYVHCHRSLVSAGGPK